MLASARHVVAATWFGGLHGVMLAASGWVGAGVGPFVATWDHWLAFGLLSAMGAKMLHDARREDDTAAARCRAIRSACDGTVGAGDERA